MKEAEAQRAEFAVTGPGAPDYEAMKAEVEAELLMQTVYVLNEKSGSVHVAASAPALVDRPFYRRTRCGWRYGAVEGVKESRESSDGDSCGTCFALREGRGT